MMQRVMNSAVRFISVSWKYDHGSYDFIEFNVMPFVKRTRFIAFSSIAKVLSTSGPYYLSERLIFRDMDTPG